MRATADGLVQSASYHPAYGNMVIVSHGFGLTTRYARWSNAFGGVALIAIGAMLVFRPQWLSFGAA